MLPREQSDRIHVAFDDLRPLVDADMLSPVTPAHHLGTGRAGGDLQDPTATPLRPRNSAGNPSLWSSGLYSRPAKLAE